MKIEIEHAVRTFASTLCITLAVGILPGSLPGGVAEAAEGARDVPVRGGHLVSAEVRAGAPDLFAWESVDERRSRVMLVGPAERQEWTFDGYLIKGARHGKRSDTLILSGIEIAAGEEGHEDVGRPETRLYDMDDGALELRWTTAALEPRYESLGISDGGSLWLGSRFREESAMVALGRVGEDEPFWTWTLEAATADAPNPLQVEQLSYARLVDDETRRAAVLWGGRLWLGRAYAPQMNRLEVPEGCREVQRFETTPDGLWVHCYYGYQGDPTHRWLLYPDAFTTAGDVRPSLTARFGKVRFLTDGTILDIDRRQGKFAAWRVTARGTELRRLGVVKLPVQAEGNRLIPAGDAWVEVTGQAGHYRVLPLPRQLTAAGGAS